MNKDLKFKFFVKFAAKDFKPEEFLKDLETVLGIQSPGSAKLFSLEDKYYMFLTVNSDAKPLNRKFFTGGSRGANLLNSHNGTDVETLCGKEFDFELQAVSSNPLTVGLCGAAVSAAKVAQADQVIASRPLPETKSIVDTVLNEYLTALAKDGYNTVSPTLFMREMYLSGKADQFIKCATSNLLSQLESLRRTFMTCVKETVPLSPMAQTLSEFCEAHPLEDIEDVYKRVKADYHGLLDGMAHSWILRTKSKKCTVWMHGAPNSGKTQISRMLAKIFPAATL